MSSEWDGIENEDMKAYLQQQAGLQKSAVYEAAVAKFVEKLGLAKGQPLSPQQEMMAKAAGEEAERRNVFGWNYKKDSKGNPIAQGLGSPSNPSSNHFAALLKAEKMGLEPPGAHAAAVRECFKSNPKWAEANLPKPVRA